MPFIPKDEILRKIKKVKRESRRLRQMQNFLFKFYKNHLINKFDKQLLKLNNKEEEDIRKMIRIAGRLAELIKYSYLNLTSAIVELKSLEEYDNWLSIKDQLENSRKSREREGNL